MPKMIKNKKKHMTKIVFWPHDIQINIDPDSYKVPETSDGSLQDRTNQVIVSLATGVDVKALSFDSLKKVTELHVDLNQELVKVILKFKHDIWETPELLELVKEYFENSSQTLNICEELERCWERARDSQSLILEALRVFDEESGLEGGNHRYGKTLDAWKKFKAAGDPFPNEFIEIFHSFCIDQPLMLDKLENRKKQLEDKLNTPLDWRRVCKLIFQTVATGILIGSVIAAAFAAPPVAVALPAAIAALLGLTGTCINMCWKKSEDAVKGQKDVVQWMEGDRSTEGFVGSIKNLKTIWVIIEKLEIDVEYPSENVDNIHQKQRKMKKIVVKEEELIQVKKDVEKINKKMEVFNWNVEPLMEQTYECIQDVRRARNVVLDEG